MNNKLLINYLSVIIAALFFACSEPVKEENKNKVPPSPLSLHVGDEKYVAIDTMESVITWTGSMAISSESHTGYVYLSKGELMIENGQLVGGAAEINMNSIEYGDKRNTNTPIKHLKSPDYFDVEKFPTSTIAITRVDSVNGNNIKITGNLTIKGVTNSVTFPAYMKVQDEFIMANGRLTIDRTDWGIRYRSGKFYDDFADQIVSDSIEFQIKILAKK